MEGAWFLELLQILEESWHSILKGYPGDKWAYKFGEREREFFFLNRLKFSTLMVLYLVLQLR